MPNGTPDRVKLPAKVYPGVFPGEYQVTVNVGKKEIHLNVGEVFVDVSRPPNDEGVDGALWVQILSAENGSFLVALPGEVQGQSSRVEVAKDALAVTG